MSLHAAPFVPFIDLKQQYQVIKNEIADIIEPIHLNAQYILGPAVEMFEEMFATYIGSKHCVGLANGTDALILAFRALGVKPGDEIIIPAHTFAATAYAVTAIQAKPILVDCSNDSYLMDLTLLESHITSRTVGICPVHLYGESINIEEICTFAQKHNLFVVEDAAQAHGATWNNRKVGSFGHIGCFSFYPGKNLGAYGDGGCIVTNSEELSKKIRTLRNHGSEKRYEYQLLAGNSRLDAIQAAVLQVKLRYLDSWNELRRAHAQKYVQLLKENLPEVITLKNKHYAPSHVYHLFVVECMDRDKLQMHLKENGIETGIHYPRPYFLEPAYDLLGIRKGQFPNAETLGTKVLSLPMFPELTNNQISHVVDQIIRFSP